ATVPLSRFDELARTGPTPMRKRERERGHSILGVLFEKPCVREVTREHALGVAARLVIRDRLHPLVEREVRALGIAQPPIDGARRWGRRARALKGARATGAPPL